MNVTEAVIDYLRGEDAVMALTDGRIFGPPGNHPEEPLRLEMNGWGTTPRKTVLVMASGLGASIGDRSDVPEIGNRIDVRCYGESPYEADQAHNAVYKSMKNLLRYRSGEIVLQVAEVGGGPLPGRDGDADWPYTLGVYVVNAVYE